MNVIKYSTKLSAHEKLVLYSITAAMWHGKGATFDEDVPVWIVQMMRETSLSRSTISRVISGLVKKGYIEKFATRTEDGMRNMASIFRVKDKIFLEFKTENPNVAYLDKYATG